MKLQHCGPATLVVCHIRHRVVHHIDNLISGGVSTAWMPLNGNPDASSDTSDLGPDFAEHPLAQSSPAALCDLPHTERHYFVLDFG